MYDVKYPSKERIERDGVLIHAEGDDLAGDPDEAARQGYKLDGAEGDVVVAPERIERDGVLVYAEGDVIDSADEETIAEVGKARKPAAAKPEKPAADKGK